MSHTRLHLGIFLVSLAMLALETLLPRVFAVYLAPNFAYFVISIALTGLSSGGILAYGFEARLMRRPGRNLALLALNFALASVVAVVGISLLGDRFNATIDGIYAGVLGGNGGDIATALSRSILLPSALFVLQTGLLLAIPFALVGACLSLAFRWKAESIGALYASDLFGAAAGCAFTILSLRFLAPPNALLLVAALAAAAALLFAGLAETGRRPLHLASAGVVAGLAAGAVVGMGRSPAFDFEIHRYAFLRSFESTPLTELAHRWTPLGRIVLARRMWSPPLDPATDLRPLEFVGMDLGGFAVVEEYTPENLAEIRNTSVFTTEIVEPVVVPGMYADVDDVLVLMAGTGQDMLRARAWYGDDVRLTGVEVNAAVYELGLGAPGSNLEAFFAGEGVEMVLEEGRHFIERTRRRFDVICLSYSGATFAAGTGALSLTPQFLFTREAYVAYLEALEPGGVIVHAESYVPEEPPRSLRTFHAALLRLDPDADLRRHLVSYTRPGINYGVIFTLYHRDPLTAERVAEIEASLADHGLDLVYSAFTEPAYVGLERYFAEVDDPEGGLVTRFRPRAQDRVIRDAQPFYHLDVGWQWVGGYLVLGYAATLACALLIAAVFLIVPLLMRSRAEGRLVLRSRRVFLAFGLLGLGFMQVEVGAFQRLELFLGSPTLSLVVILGTLLTWTGVGSLVSRRWFDSWLTLRRACGLVVAAGLGLVLFLDHGIYPLMSLGRGAKIAVIALALLPVGVLLGTLFPELVRRLQRHRPRAVPWAFAVNGIFSVAASNLGALVYVLAGADLVILGGLASYALLGAMAGYFRDGGGTAASG